MEIDEKVRQHYREIGKLGGQKVLKKLGRKHLAKIGKLGAKSRWKKLSTTSI